MMRSRLVCAILWLVLGAETAAAQMPPAEYDHAFAGRLLVYRLDPARAAEVCQNSGMLFGCALVPGVNVKKGTCVIVISTASWHPEVTYRHERAHCNGWRH